MDGKMFSSTVERNVVLVIENTMKKRDGSASIADRLLHEIDFGTDVLALMINFLFFSLTIRLIVFIYREKEDHGYHGGRQESQ